MSKKRMEKKENYQAKTNKKLDDLQFWLKSGIRAGITIAFLILLFVVVKSFL